jgi:uncharacterized integral membrane protein
MLMGNFWLKVKIWTKTTLFAVVVIYSLLFIYNNSGEQVHFWWWFGHNYEHEKLTFGFTAFVGGIILTILVRTTYATMSQVRDLQSRSRNQRIERDVQDMKEKAGRLQTRAAPAGTNVAGAFEAPNPRTDETGV